MTLLDENTIKNIMIGKKASIKVDFSQNILILVIVRLLN